MALRELRVNLGTQRKATSPAVDSAFSTPPSLHSRGNVTVYVCQVSEGEIILSSGRPY